MNTQKDLTKLIDRYMETEGLELHSAIRDIFTDLFHIVDKNNLNREEIIQGADDVFEDEKAQGL